MQSKLTRRAILAGAPAVVAVAAMPALAAQPDPLREGVQALVNEIRQSLSREIVMSQWAAFHETADRLEALPGIEPVCNDLWEEVRYRTEDFQCKRRLAGGAA